MTDSTDAIVGIIPTIIVAGLASKMIGNTGNDNRRPTRRLAVRRPAKKYHKEHTPYW